MQWIVDNKEWFFSGIGVSIIAAIIGLVKTKLKKIDARNDHRVSQVLNVTNVVNNTSQEYLTDLKIRHNNKDKTSLNILFVDDEKFDNVDILKNAGWLNTKRVKDIKRLDAQEIIAADVIFVDINGVGTQLFPKEQGLGLAAKIKEIYPQKYVVVYSALPHSLHSLFGKVDAVLPKDADPYQYISILENLKQ